MRSGSFSSTICMLSSGAYFGFIASIQRFDHAVINLTSRTIEEHSALPQSDDASQMSPGKFDLMQRTDEYLERGHDCADQC